LGPSTDPTVVAHTTRASARPRCAGTARSAAAYRACSEQAVDAPNANTPSKRQRHGENGRTEHSGGPTQAGGGIGTRDVASQQSADGDPHRDPEPAEGDPGAEDADRPALHPCGIDGRGAGAGHNPIDRPMISFMISFVPP
jgi:hypothetical protein